MSFTYCCKGCGRYNTYFSSTIDKLCPHCRTINKTDEIQRQVLVCRMCQEHIDGLCENCQFKQHLSSTQKEYCTELGIGRTKEEKGAVAVPSPYLDYNIEKLTECIRAMHMQQEILENALETLIEKGQDTQPIRERIDYTLAERLFLENILEENK